MLRRLAFVGSFMAVVNLLLLAAVAGYAWSQGWLERDRVREAVAILKGEVGEEGQSEAETSGEGAPDQAAERPRATDERIRSNRKGEAKYRIEFARREKEIQQRWEQVAARELELLQRIESFERTVKMFQSEREELAKKEGDSGFQAVVSTLSGIDAKSAKELLKTKDDADVVRTMLAMDERKRNKIVKACKTSEERLWIGRILGQFNVGDAIQAEDLAAAP